MRSDVELRHDVEEALKWSAHLNATRIGISTEGGVVTLSGHVPTWAEKWEAERIAKRVTGIKGLANEIGVDIPGSHARSDTDIAKTAVDILRWNASIPDDAIQLTVKDGCITLDGKVEWRHQREVAENSVRYLTGVRRVTNHIAVKPRAALMSVKEEIAKAFERSARLDADNIDVDIDNHKVTLRGNVSSYVELEDAEEAAWAAPGVSEVDNQLVVES